MAEYTPMMKQYFEIKEQYSECILMYRLGDFYEMFFEDAKIASKVLEIALTGRECGQQERAPMCGVPFHAVDSYIAKLISAGYNVAICEQTENPAEAKGIVKREVIRVVTPGTIMDSAALESGKNNYICSLCIEGRRAGISFVDITTGEVSVNEFGGNRIEVETINEMSRFSPVEVVMDPKTFEKSGMAEKISDKFGCKVHSYKEECYETRAAEKRVSGQFGPEMLEFSQTGQANKSLGALISFLEETQKTDLKNLRTVEVINKKEYMGLDQYSIKNLELLETLRDKKTKGSLFSVLNQTKTSMGSRLLRHWITMPLVNAAKIQNRHRAVGFLVSEPLIREEICEHLKKVQDIERIIGRVTYKTANCKELLAISESFSQLVEVKRLLKQCSAGILKQLYFEIDSLDDVRDIIDRAIDPNAPNTLREGKLIKSGFSTEIDECREVMKNGVDWINGFAEEEKQKTGIKNIKVGYNRVFGYYLELSKQNAAEVPEYFIRKQTLSNCERYITPQIKEVEEKITEASSRIVDMEYELFCQVRELTGAQLERIQKTSRAVAELDVLCSFASVAEKNRYTEPRITMQSGIVIKDGRHPVVESIKQTGQFIPNDAELDCGDKQISIITGPNMAGKSTYMRQTALIVLMAQMGSFVPASSAEIGIVDSIFTRVGASDDLAAGQSTFMVEMNEVAYILDNATSKSLVILDEIGRGTSTYDGLSIAWAVVEYIANKRRCGAKTLFATHYHELTELENEIEGVKNYCVAVKKNGDNITFLRKIICGGADGSYGIEVAALAGVKKEVTNRAKEILKGLEERDGGGAAERKTPKGVQKAAAALADEQLTLLEVEENRALTELREMNLDEMTPMEALNKLYDLKAKAMQ